MPEATISVQIRTSDDRRHCDEACSAYMYYDGARCGLKAWLRYKDSTEECLLDCDEGGYLRCLPASLRSRCRPSGTPGGRSR